MKRASYMVFLRAIQPVTEQCERRDGWYRTAVSVIDAVVIWKYDLHMRTTISLEDRLAAQVRQRAAAQGLSVSAFIAKVLDDSLKRTEAEPQPPFRLVTVGGEGTYPGIDLDRPRALMVAEDEVRYGAVNGDP